MADSTLRITRAQLAQVAGGNPRAIKALESLALAVGETLPEAIDEVRFSALLSLLGADGSKSASDNAAMLAANVQALVSACQRQASDIRLLRNDVELLRAELQSAQARLSSAVALAQSDAAHAITLSIGV